MANKPPAFLFYGKDWLSSDDVQLMTLAQRGLYIGLIARAWDNDRIGYLSSDPAVLWRLGGADNREQFEELAPLVLKQFKTTRNGKFIYHPRLVAERKKQQKFHEKQAASGRKGALARKNKELRVSDPSATLEPKTNRNQALPLHFAPALPKDKERPTPVGSSAARVCNKSYGSLSVADGFERFYLAYPRKKGRAEAQRAWRKVKPEAVDAIIARLEVFKLGEWKGKDPQYIPYPATWLNGRRWEDEIEAGGSNGANRRTHAGAVPATSGKYDAVPMVRASNIH
jgi:hypothetical protein